MKKSLLVLTLLLSLTGCIEHPQSHNQTLHVYRTHKLAYDGSDAWLYYYILQNTSNNTFAYVTSPAPIINFNNTVWSSSKTNPVANEKDVEEQPEQEVHIEGEIGAEGESTSEVSESSGGSEGNDIGPSSDVGSPSSADSGSSGGDSGGGGGE